jgi:hypothetical protein
MIDPREMYGVANWNNLAQDRNQRTVINIGFHKMGNS